MRLSVAGTRFSSHLFDEKTVSLRELLGDYSGPDLYFDFDEHNGLIGAEVLV